MGLFFSMFYDRVFGPVTARIAMLGLDAAGKTTTLYKLKLGDVVTTIPTVGFNVEEIVFKNLTMTVWDVGGQKIIRSLWHHYLQNNDALIFVIDSTDRTRFKEAKEELWGLLELDHTRNSCVLVLANKQDLPQAANPSEITDALDLFKLRDRAWYVQGSCATTGEGIVEGLTWLADTIKTKKKTPAF